MAEKAICFVTQSDEGIGAFGIRSDTDESVYFPRGMAEALELEEFDELEAILVKNDRIEPVWKAARIRRIDNGDEEE